MMLKRGEAVPSFSALAPAKDNNVHAYAQVRYVNRLGHFCALCPNHHASCGRARVRDLQQIEETQKQLALVPNLP